jgi:hypothetical protein
MNSVKSPVENRTVTTISKSQKPALIMSGRRFFKAFAPLRYEK